MKRFLKIIKNPKLVLFYLESKGLFNFLPDKRYLKLFYKLRIGNKLNLDNPKTFNEKLQWLKLYNRKDIYTTMVDKYEAKKYVSDSIGEEYIIPTLGVWDNFDDIDFDSLPNQFVLKCTHDSGGLIICKDKSKLDLKKARKKINKTLRINYYKHGREWPYKNVKPRIIAEKFVKLNGPECAEYKFFCFNGKVKCILVCKGDAHGLGENQRTNDFLDVDFNRIDVKVLFPHSKTELRKPKELDKLMEIAEKFAKDIPHVRFDTYLVDGKIYFGEMTFFHNSGFEPYEPEEWDYRFGSWLQLPNNKIQGEK